MKVEFIVCYTDGTWHTESEVVPDDLYSTGNGAIEEWWLEHIAPNKKADVAHVSLSFIYGEEAPETYMATVEVRSVYEKEFEAHSLADAISMAQEDMKRPVHEDNGWWEITTSRTSSLDVFRKRK